MNPLRSTILAAAGNDALRGLVAGAPVSRELVHRFVAGESTSHAVAVTGQLVADGIQVTLDYLGEDTTDAATAENTVLAYQTLVEALRAERLAGWAEISVKLSAVGGRLDEQLAFENAERICESAEHVGTAVTLDMEDHTSTDMTLRVLAKLRRKYPRTGAVLQAYLRRTLDDCRALAVPASRVRLCKGAYAEPASVAYTDPHQIDLNYVRCVNVLLAGNGYPMFATHDPRLQRVVAERARWYDREPGGYEFQMLYGVRPDAQRQLARTGETVRVYVPYGEQWYGYLMRRLAERPANLGFFARALVSRW